MQAQQLLYGLPNSGPGPMACDSIAEAGWLELAQRLPAIDLPAGYYADTAHNHHAEAWRPIWPLSRRYALGSNKHWLQPWLGAAPSDMSDPNSPLTWAGFSLRNDWEYQGLQLKREGGVWRPSGQTARWCYLLLVPALASTLDAALRCLHQYLTILDKQGWQPLTETFPTRLDIGRTVIRQAS